MANAAPYEIVGAPLRVWLTAPDPEFPGLDEEPGEGFLLLGTSGDKNYTEDGVTVTHDQAQNYFRGAGATAPRKAFRTEEDLLFALTLADISPAQYAKVLNDAAVSTQAPDSGQHGEQSFELWQGLHVAQFGLLARGVSPLHGTGAAQYEVATCCQDGNPAPVFTKGEPAGLACQFRALDASGDGTGFGVLRVYSDDPTGS